MQPINQCRWCEKPIRGRSDKKFCDDSCRNSFNNQRTQGDYTLVRNINHALGRNRRILHDLLAPDKKLLKVDRETLLLQGFQFKYCTHLLPDRKGDLYYYCYDFSYHPLPQDCYLISRKGAIKKIKQTPLFPPV